MAKFLAEITIRGIRTMTEEQKKHLGQWIKSRGQQFKKEKLHKLANTFSYGLAKREKS